MIGRGSQQERLADGKVWRWYDRETGETTQVRAPVYFEEDFRGGADIANRWNVITVGTPGVITANTAGVNADLLPDLSSGIFRLKLGTTAELEEAAIDFGDDLAFDMRFNFQIEARLRFVNTASMTNVSAVFGIGSDYDATKDNMTASAWHRLNTSLLLRLETDDAVTDSGAISSGVTLVDSTWYVFRIKFTPLTGILFFRNTTQLIPATVFNMNGISAANAIVQPILSIQKSGGAAAPTMDIDYVKCWGTRSSA